MAYDSFVQVAPDSTGKMVDMDLVTTAAGALIYRQRAKIMGEEGDAIVQMLAIQQQTLSVLRAILATLSALSNSPISEEDFPPQ